jgi:anti-sigma-K factor RskA
MLRLRVQNCGNRAYGWGSMREWLVLVAGLAMMLVWAGIMEAFFSQHHAPVLPYGFKVAVAAAELVLLTTYLLMVGRKEIVAESGATSENR